MGGDVIIYLPDSSALAHVYNYIYRRAVRKVSISRTSSVASM
jgi:hypothetical protein